MKKTPTLADLVAQERECRGLLESTLRDVADTLSEKLPEMEVFDSDDIVFLADEIAQHGRGIDFGAQNWSKAVKALAEARAKKKAA